MGQGYLPGMAGRGFGSGFGSAPATNNLNQGTNNIGQVYQDMGQNYQRFGQAYQQATQAANQLRSATTTQQQQMNQYLQALQTALGGLSTAGQNTTNQQPIGFTSPLFPKGYDPSMLHALPPQTLGATGEQGLGNTGESALNAGQQGIERFLALHSPSGQPTPTLGINQAGGVPGINADQQNMINAQQQFFTGTIAPTYNDQLGARGIYGSPSMSPQDFYNQYASVIFGDQASAYTPNFQG